MKSLILFLAVLIQLHLSAQPLGRISAFRGQTLVQSSGPVWGSPTNNTDGTTPLAWYVLQYYTTNTTPIVQDLWTNHYDLTNLSASSKWPSLDTTLLNGYKPLKFTADGQFVKSVNYTSSQPHELVMVIKINSAAPTPTTYISDSADSNFRNRLVLNSGLLIYNAGSSVSSYPVTNQWYIQDAIFSGSSSKLYTNNVQAAAGNPGTVSINGFTLGESFATADPTALMSVAEIICYGRGLMPGTNSTWRANVYAYLKAKYGL